METAGGGVAPKWFTAKELRRLLAQQAALYEPRLREVSLVVELGLTDREVSKLKLIAGKCAIQFGPEFLLQSLRQSDAALAVLLPHLGRQEFHRNKFWPLFAEAIGLGYESIEGSIQHDVSELFLTSLHRLGLPVFHDVGHRFLDNILLHGGIPDYCLDDWFRLLIEGQRQQGADASAIVTWAIARFDSGGLAYVDMPVQRLLRHGRDFAVDLADRSLDLLSQIRRSGDGEDGNPAILGLRPEFLSAAQSVLRREPDRSTARPAQARQARPVLRLDPDRGQILVVMPEVADADAHVTWRVRFGDVVREVEPPRLWGGATLRFASVAVPLDRPVTHVGVGMPLVGEKYSVPVVADPSRPALFFDDSGASIPAGVSLPAEPVWIIAPGQRIQVGDKTTPVSDLGAPVGWAGWTMQLWDLSGEVSVQIGSKTRAVAARGRARLTLAAPNGTLDEVTIRGLPVTTTRPTIELPSDVTSSWSLVVTDTATGRVVAQRPITGGIRHDPFDGIAAPIVGSFAITVRGPLGRGFTRSLSIAEGLRVTSSPEFRLFIPEGLSASNVELRFDGGFVHEVSRGDVTSPNAPRSNISIHFGPKDSTRHVVLNANGKRADLEVAPAALAAATLDSTGASEWTHAPVSVVDADVGETTLLLRIGNGATPPLRAMHGHVEVQVVSPQMLRAGGNVSYDLRQISDSVAVAKVSHLVLGSEDDQVPVARIRPRILARGVDVEGERVVLLGATWPDLEVVLWSTGAPLQQPIVLPVDDKFTVHPPPGHPLAGRAVVSVRMRDDWVVQTVPRFPRRRSVMASAHVVASADETSWVSGVVAGRRQGGDHRPRVLSELEESWAALLIDDALNPNAQMPASSRAELTSALTSSPPDAATALARLPISAKSAARCLLATGLASVATAPGVDVDDATVRAVLEASPVAAVMLYSGHMVGPVSDEELPIVASRILGANAVTLLRSGADEDATAGRFGEEFKHLQKLAQHTPDQLDVLIQELGLTPKGLLDQDSRSLAASVIMRRLDSVAMRDLARDAKKVVLGTRAALESLGFARVVEALDARTSTIGGSQSLSGASLAWALALRYGARGHVPLQRLQRQFPSWESQAGTLGYLMAIDLVLAEIHAAHDHVAVGDDPEASESERLAGARKGPS